MRVFRWLRSITGVSAVTSLASQLQHVGEKPGWPILIENLDESEIRSILDFSGIDGWAYFVQPGPLPATTTGATWVTVPRAQAHDAERTLRRYGATIGGQSLVNDSQEANQ